MKDASERRKLSRARREVAERRKQRALNPTPRPRELSRARREIAELRKNKAPAKTPAPPPMPVVPGITSPDGLPKTVPKRPRNSWAEIYASNLLIRICQHRSKTRPLSPVEK